MIRVIHIGDGRHIEIEEGALRKPLPSRPAPLPIVADPPKVWWRNSIPGYREWVSRRREALHNVSPNYPEVRKPGMTNRQVRNLLAKAEALTKRDMENLQKAGIDLGDMGNEALQETIKTMRTSKDAKVRLQAARQVLEWTKAKPAAKSEVTVNQAEKWLDDLNNETNDGQETGDA